MGLDRRVDLTVLMRHFPAGLSGALSQPFAETSGARNETGVYLGIEVRPHRFWKLSAYFDAWHHPWLRFDADAPSRGYEYRARLTYFRKRNLEVYLEVRDETKERNIDKIDGKNNFTCPPGVPNRLHLAKNASKTLELRSRIDIGFSENEINTTQRGFVIYQDVIFKPIGFPLSFTTRFALFDTGRLPGALLFLREQPAVRLLHPGLLQPARALSKPRYKGIRNLTIEGASTEPTGATRTPSAAGWRKCS